MVSTTNRDQKGSLSLIKTLRAVDDAEGRGASASTTSSIGPLPESIGEPSSEPGGGGEPTGSESVARRGRRLEQRQGGVRRSATSQAAGEGAGDNAIVVGTGCQAKRHSGGCLNCLDAVSRGHL
jgi:hypothetical protein